MGKQLRYQGKTKRGNSKTTVYIPTKGASKKKVRIRKKNGKVMEITTVIKTVGGIGMRSYGKKRRRK